MNKYVGIKSLTNNYGVPFELLPQMDELSGHSTPHCFKFIKKSGFEDVLMYSKLWSSDAWCSETEATNPLKVSVQ